MSDLQAVQLSQIWVETFPEPGPHPDLPAPLAFVGDPERYAARFGALRPGTRDADGLHLPWETPAQRFWQRYVGKPLELLEGKEALGHQVPFRAELPAKLELRPPGRALAGHGYAELFLYPHGMAVAATVRLAGDVGLEAAAEALVEVTRDPFPVRGQKRSLSLAALAAQALGRYRRLALGDGSGSGGAWSQPFTVVTVVRGARAHAEREVAEGDAAHLFADRVTGLYPAPRDPAPLEASRLSGLHGNGHLLYAQPRARAVWYPELFAFGKRKHSLSCYHRNLVFCTLQVESLGHWAWTAAEALRERGYLHFGAKRYAPGVLDKLADLHEGDRNRTYQSRSPRRQMADNGIKKAADLLAAYLAQG